jgi:hypothetical protein
MLLTTDSGIAPIHGITITLKITKTLTFGRNTYE